MKKEANSIVIFKSKDGIKVDVKLQGETVWLTQKQITLLFDVDRTVITRHLNNIFKEGELIEKSNVQKMHIANSDRPVKYYSLDAVISVGYRVNSNKATQFRIWATKTLKQHLIKGYTVNENKLLEFKDKFNELKDTINFIQSKSKNKLLKGQEGELLALLKSYSKTLKILDDYDNDRLKTKTGKKETFQLNYDTTLNLINSVKKDLQKNKLASDLFGKENSDKLKALLGNIYQTFGGVDLYKSLDEKAANLLYFIIKDHPFIDGNKRLGSFIFVYFLDKNNYLYKKSGEKKINDNALTALALLIATSHPSEKEKLVKIVINLIQE